MFVTDHYKHLSIELGDLKVSIFYMEATGFALAHNRIPVIPLVTVEFDSEGEAESPEIEISIRATVDDTELFNTGPLPCGPMKPGQFRTMELHDRTRVPASTTLESSESRPGEMTAFVRVGERVVEKQVDLQVLAPNEWFNSPAYYESLAAFVQPNADAVVPVLSDVADILEERTGSADLCGYQQGPDRAVQIAGAVYEALQKASIRYINPPASFENTGQRIRSSSDVLTTRFGTCIDLSLAFAAVAEQCGLHPVIIMVPGHAMAGILLTDDPLPTPVVFEPTIINNYLRSGRVMPIDAVYYSQREFADVVTDTRSVYLDTPIHGLIDVFGSHRDGIRPLPSTANRTLPLGVGSANFTDTRTAPANVPAHSAPPKDQLAHEPDSSSDNPVVPPAKPAAEIDSADDLAPAPAAQPWKLPTAGVPAHTEASTARRRVDEDTSPARVQAWKRELLDLSLRNRLLNMNTGPEVLDFHLPDGSLADLDDKIHAGEKIAIHPIDDVSDNRRLQGITSVTQLPNEQITNDLIDRNRLYAGVSEKRYPGYFRNLNRLVRTYLEETGSANLYLSLGALLHTAPSGRAAMAPLFLIPVKIVGGRGKARFQIQVDTTQEASPNYSLVEWLQQEHGITIEALSSPRLDESGLDIAYALSAISDALIEAQLPFTVMESSRLLIARFSTYGMWKDLRDHWETFMKAPVFRHLSTSAGSDFPDPAGTTPIRDLLVDETELALPIPADGAQLKAVAAAAAGYSFVLEGPPGTGKSQTITNLIAHALDQGKKILFVAEKQAALDVVRGRLAKVGLAPFTLDLHGTEQSPSAIKRQLKDSIDAEVFYDSHAWEAAVANLRSRLAPLTEYPGRIHDLNGAGHSLWSASSALLDLDSGPEADIPESFVTTPPVSLDSIRETVGDIAVQARITDFSAVSRWLLVGGRIGGGFDAGWQRLQRAEVALAGSPALRSLAARDDVNDVITALRDVAEVPIDQRLDADQRRLYSDSIQRLKSLADQIHRFHGEVKPVAASFSPTFIQSGDPQPLLGAIAETRTGVFGRKKKLARYEQLLRPALPAGIAHIDLQGAHNPDFIESQLLRLPQLRGVAENLGRALNGIPGAELLHGRSALDPTMPREIWQRSETLRESIKLSESHASQLELLDQLESSGVRGDAVDTVEEVLGAWREWVEVLGATDRTLEAWQRGRNWVDAWLESTDEWAADVNSHGAEAPRRVAQWSAVAQPLREAGLGAFLAQIESEVIAANDVEMALHRGIASASIAERSSRFLLGDFHPDLKDNELAQLNRAMEKVRDESKQALPARLLQRRPFTQGNLEGRVALLRRQLDAKRNAKSFRMLLKEYGEEILAVAPCFFVSPASLATFVPPDSVTFDIVVFDEASQVTVDQAMGALGRGNSAIIVGDSKQMPPTRIGKTTVSAGDGTDDADGDGDPMAGIDDLESILSEAVESGLPQVWLSWHYRSKDESLISFSNDHYYEGKLSSLPSPGHIPGAGVRVRRVDGQFIRDKKDGPLRTNPVEADAIVESITRRVNDPLTGGESIGVVTFNMQQRNLIMDLLEQCDDPLVQKLLVPGPDGIFVKNLENVQGDERDVILFSTAFSKKTDGGPMPMNFGPLTRAGGERRLNVAVTRARKEVEVFCSFDPHEIDVNRTKSVGMRHLRDYLEAGLAVSSPEAIPSSTGINDNRIRDDIARRLRERGWVVETDYGRSAYTLDLVVRPADDERWHAAILTDGEKWSKLPTVADRDLTPNLLEGLMEWAATIRAWLPEWLSDADGLVDRIEKELTAAGERIRVQDERHARALEEAERVLEAERRRIEAERREEEEARQRALAELEAESAEGDGPGDDAPEIDETEVEERSAELLGKDSDAEGEDEASDGVQWSAEMADDEHPFGEARSTDDPHLSPGPESDDLDFDAGSTRATSNSPAHEPMPAADAELVPVRGIAAKEVHAAPSTSDFAGTVPTEVPYIELAVEKLGEREELERGFAPNRTRELRDEVQRVLSESGPVKLELLRLSIVQRFGRQRTSQRLNDTTVDRLIPASHIHQEEESGFRFVWPTAGGPDDWHHFRHSVGRNLPDIPVEEIRNVARVLLVEDPAQISLEPEVREAFSRRILSVFGISRYTKVARERIDAALEAL